MPIPTLIKQPSESRLYTMEFAANLAVGETITSVTSVVASPTTLLVLAGGPTFSGTKVFQRIEGGTADVQYKITVVVVTSAGNTLEGEGYLRVQAI